MVVLLGRVSILFRPDVMVCNAGWVLGIGWAVVGARMSRILGTVRWDIGVIRFWFTVSSRSVILVANGLFAMGGVSMYFVEWYFLV
jgi:hypothetical protein